MKTCPNCHKEVEENSKFCTLCGSYISSSDSTPTDDDARKIYLIKLGFEDINKIELSDSDMLELPTKELKRYYKAGYEIVNKIKLIKLGFKKKNNFELSDENMNELPQRELDRYYKTGIREDKIRFIK